MDSLMSIWVFLIGSLIGVIAGVALSYRTAVTPLHQRIGKLTADSQQNKTIIDQYPYDFENFRFIGDPIDGIQFENDTILFVRFINQKASSSPEQDHIKYLIKNGKVQWFECTII